MAMVVAVVPLLVPAAGAGGRAKGRPGENNGDKKPIALTDYAFPLLPPVPV